MREEILKILDEEQKSLDTLSIMSKIKDNYTTEDLKELNECLREMVKEADIKQRKDGAYLLLSRSNLKKGILEVTDKGYGFVLLPEKDLFIPKDKLKDAVDGDEVLAQVLNIHDERQEGMIVRVIKRNLESGLGEIYDENGTFKVKPINIDADYTFELEETDKNIVDGLIVKLSIVKELNKKHYLVKIDSILGHKNSPDIDTLKIVNEFKLPFEFSKEALDEASSMPSEINEEEIPHRVDLRDKMIFTIDGSDTKDIDDAISLEILKNGNYELGVHIADVSYYVKEGSQIKKEALERGNSVYLADRVIPMLPVELSNGICSLNPNVDRFTTSCVMEIDKEGNTVNSKIFKGVIRSVKKMNYKSVNLVFEGNTPQGYEPYENKLKEMLELSKILQKYKVKRGSIDFLSSEVKLIVDENGKVTEVTKQNEGLGENLIEDFMVAANEAVANTINNMGLPFVYRVHDEPSPEKIKEFISALSILGIHLDAKISFNGGILPSDVQKILSKLKEEKNYTMLNKRMLRCMRKAEYSPENIGHFGIASPCYTHFTSPIRRYSDLMVHMFIDEYLVKKNKSNDFRSYWGKSLPYITDHISKTEREAEDCEYAVNDMKIAEYMENHIGEEYDAIIDTTLNKGFFIQTNNLIEGLVSLDTIPGYYTYKEELLGYTNKKNRVVFRQGDKVRVKCIGASKELRQIDFVLVGDNRGSI